MNLDLLTDKESFQCLSTNVSFFSNILFEYFGMPQLPYEGYNPVTQGNALKLIADKFHIPFIVAYDYGTIHYGLRNLIKALEEKGIISRETIRQKAIQKYSTERPDIQRDLDTFLP